MKDDEQEESYIDLRDKVKDEFIEKLLNVIKKILFLFIILSLFCYQFSFTNFQSNIKRMLIKLYGTVLKNEV